MADDPRTDPISAWLDSVRRLGSAAGTVADPGEALRRVQELQDILVRGAFLPADTMVEIARQLAEPLREQADAFERASQAFLEIASLLRREADLLDGAGSLNTGPPDAHKGVVGASKPPAEKPPDG